MFERFTDRARRVVVLAQEEARLLSHNYIGTEHILLGLIREGEGVAASALQSLGISLEAVRSKVEEVIGTGERGPVGHIPFTPRAKKVLELSLREALQLGHDYIGTEHILLGLIREGQSVAAKVLRKLGADLDRVTERVVEILQGYERHPKEDAVRQAAAAAEEGGEEEEGGPPEPRCPRCRRLLSESITFRTISAKEAGGDAEREVVVVFCGSCGDALGAF
jgi:ATP-dependent Clp protease ATP-binding subunit ClpC